MFLRPLRSNEVPVDDRFPLVLLWLVHVPAMMCLDVVALCLCLYRAVTAKDLPDIVRRLFAELEVRRRLVGGAR